MTTAQTHLYFRAWQAAAAAHSWNTKAGVASALSAHLDGKVWESPALDQILAAIYELAANTAAAEARTVLPEDMRHAVTVLALGRSVSSKKFTNADFDRVLILLRLLAEPQNLDHLLAFESGAEAGARQRQIHVITRAPQPYYQRIATDRFGHADLDRLSLTQLQQLALTIRQRLARHATANAELQVA